MRALRFGLAALAALGSLAMVGCSGGEDESTPSVSMPPPKEPTPGMSEQGSANGPSSLKGPSND